MTEFSRADIQDLQTAGTESQAHLWPKVELAARKREERDPYYPGEYRFERKMADRVPDCLILGEGVNRWIEFVAGSDQPYRAKTREALRLGAIIHWVFHEDHIEQIEDARAALGADLQQSVEFGRYSPRLDTLSLGDPITYRNIEMPVEALEDLVPAEILGYRKGAARIQQKDLYLDLGLFDLGGSQRRLFASDPDAHYYHSLAPGEPMDNLTRRFPSKDGLRELIDRGQLTRLGPVATR
ncbi:hypothetical protein [Halobacterium salinarum]|uniref:hypothetical protein n=1 Tax=Halobacterium salinarum TaxID=2242 RepID=UPI00255776D9|nr:hypothetical protein [Halobacterium salinarum]MDL0134049.1 hypothetical protein [Halobacterium salinarum]